MCSISVWSLTMDKLLSPGRYYFFLISSYNSFYSTVSTMSLIPTWEGHTILGESSPEYPALKVNDPGSTTNAVISSVNIELFMCN